MNLVDRLVRMGFDSEHIARHGFEPEWPGSRQRRLRPLSGLTVVTQLVHAFLLLLALWLSVCEARTLHVGPTRDMKLPSQAARLARTGDLVVIDAGEYRGDAAVWRADDLTIRSSGGEVVLIADGAHAQGKAIWITAGRNTTVEGIAFLGASVPHRNGAGIRHQGFGLTLRRCRFEYNEMGVLTHNDPRDEILIEESIFAHNGPGPRHNHNLYVGGAGKLVVRASWFHHGRIGHNVKSRARVTHLFYNRIVDEVGGYSSYAVDLPQGGDALLVGNLIQQGPRTENWALVSFGAEGNRYPRSRLRMAHNTLVNDAKNGIFVHVHPGVEDIQLVNNLLVGRGRNYVGVPRKSANDVRLHDSPFIDRASYDFRLRDEPRLVDVARPLPEGIPAPTMEYAHPAGSAPRPVVGRQPDVGALEKRL